MPFAYKYPEQISAEQRRELEEVLKTTQDVKVYRRAKVIFYMYEGYPTELITKHTDYPRRSQYYWLRRYTLEGVEGLYDHPRSGRPIKGSERLAPNLDLKAPPIPEWPSIQKESLDEPAQKAEEPRLSEPARFTLQQMREHHSKGYLRDRAHTVLLWDQHYSIEAISDIF